VKIEDIDKNFQEKQFGDEKIIFLDALTKPFRLEGFPWYRQHRRLYRLPKDFTEAQVNQGQLKLGHHTSGGAVRFRTDSRYIALRARLSDTCDMAHMPRTGSMGFDMFRGKGSEMFHLATVKPERDQEIVEQIFVGNDTGMQDWQLNLPLYSGVTSLEIGVKPEAEIEPPTPHAVKQPILFYGSSITQGACASRPGNAYTSMLCRELDAEQINLGFAGSAHGEFPLAEAIGDLALSAFVMDYDHNPPTVEPLRQTHEKFFQIVRQKQPDLPIVLISRPDFWNYKNTEACRERREVIQTTYRNALEKGDKHVFFVDGEQLFGKEHRTWCTVDTCHPNDLGFYKMFEHIRPVLQEAVGR
jgi:lysophospholipase L1-like esterase